MPKPNKENIVNTCLEGLRQGHNFELVLTKVNCSRPTFAKYWKIATEMYRVTQNEAQEAIKAQTIATALEGAKMGLKSKQELVLEVQKMLDDDIYEESVLDLKSGKVTRFYRKLTPLERKALYERIAKFEGMDAPAKQEIEHKGSVPISIEL